jgi:hypothetical protein
MGKSFFFRQPKGIDSGCTADLYCFIVRLACDDESVTALLKIIVEIFFGILYYSKNKY